MDQLTLPTRNRFNLNQRFLVIALLLPAAAFFASCSSTSRSTSDGPSSYMTAYVDPDFAGRSFDSISVHHVSDVLDERKELEEELTWELRDIGIIAWESGSIISPTRTWDSTAIINQLRHSGVDAMVRVHEVNNWIVSSWIPEKEKTTVTTKEKIELEGKSKKSSQKRESEKETTTTVSREKSGGYMNESLRRRFNVELIDIESGRVAWTGAIVVKGSNFSWLADRIARQLRIDKMIIRAITTPDR